MGRLSFDCCVCCYARDKCHMLLELDLYPHGLPEGHGAVSFQSRTNEAADVSVPLDLVYALLHDGDRRKTGTRRVTMSFYLVPTNDVSELFDAYTSPEFKATCTPCLEFMCNHGRKFTGSFR